MDYKGHEERLELNGTQKALFYRDCDLMYEILRVMNRAVLIMCQECGL
jgi:hypothetical protein